MKVDVITNCNLLIDEGNDPVCDPEPLRYPKSSYTIDQPEKAPESDREDEI